MTITLTKDDWEIEYSEINALEILANERIKDIGPVTSLYIPKEKFGVTYRRV